MGNPEQILHIHPETLQRAEMNSHILLVDDNPIQATTRRLILERAGYAVTVANSGARALEMFQNPTCPEPFGMIFTDHLMPEMNGPALVSELRQRKIGLPIVVLSGLPDAERAYEGLDVIFRLKPFPPESLIALAREILGPPMARTA